MAPRGLVVFPLGAELHRHSHRNQSCTPPATTTASGPSNVGIVSILPRQAESRCLGNGFWPSRGVLSSLVEGINKSICANPVN